MEEVDKFRYLEVMIEVDGEQIIKIKLKTNKHSNERLGEVRGKQRERERINKKSFTDVY